MPDDAPGAADRPEGPAPGSRLDSWKEIAAYLKRDVTTVRRWEKRQGLPVHRHLHERRDSVYAYTREIDAWWEGRRNQLAENGVVDGASTATETGAPEPSGNGNTPVPSPASPRLSLAWVLVASFAIATLILGTLLIARSRAKEPRAEAQLRFSIFPPDETSFGSVSLSPDGRLLAFTAGADDGRALLWIRSLDSTTVRAVPDTEGAMFPFWAPTSDIIGFFAGGKLWSVDASGGTPRAIGEAANGRGGTWNRAGDIVFAPGREGALFRVSAAGGPATPITEVDQSRERGHLWPAFLPDGRHFLFLAHSSQPDLHVLYAGALDGSEPTQLFPLASNATYVHDGYLVFERERRLLAQPFDPVRLALTGEPITLLEKVQQQRGFDHKADFSVSETGVLMYRAMQSPATRLVWRDRKEKRSALISEPAEYYEPVLSPDEARVAIDLFNPQLSKRFGYGVAGVRSDVWIVDRATGTPSQFTTDPAADWGPVWSPDGGRIVFSSNRRGRLELYQKSTAGNAPDETPLASQGANPIAQSWSPDGTVIVYAAYDPKTRMDLWLLPMAGHLPARPLVQTEFNESQGVISPDGRWLAYTSSESGRDEVYVQSFPAAGSKWRVSIDGGGDPRWRADGKELFFIGADRQLLAVSVRTDGRFEHGAIVPLFDTGLPPHWYESRNLYDVSRDGAFLFMTPVEDDRSSPFTIVINWTKSLSK